MTNDGIPTVTVTSTLSLASSARVCAPSAPASSSGRRILFLNARPPAGLVDDLPHRAGLDHGAAPLVLREERLELRDVRVYLLAFDDPSLRVHHGDLARLLVRVYPDVVHVLASLLYRDGRGFNMSSRTARVCAPSARASSGEMCSSGPYHHSTYVVPSGLPFPLLIRTSRTSPTITRQTATTGTNIELSDGPSSFSLTIG